MGLEITDEDIQSLFQGEVLEQDKKEYLCPRCVLPTKRILFRSKSLNKFLIQVIDQNNRSRYKGIVENGLGFCFQCKSKYEF